MLRVSHIIWFHSVGSCVSSSIDWNLVLRCKTGGIWYSTKPSCFVLYPIFICFPRSYPKESDLSEPAESKYRLDDTRAWQEQSEEFVPLGRVSVVRGPSDCLWMMRLISCLTLSHHQSSQEDPRLRGRSRWNGVQGAVQSLGPPSSGKCIIYIFSSEGSALVMLLSCGVTSVGPHLSTASIAMKRRG